MSDMLILLGFRHLLTDANIDKIDGNGGFLFTFLTKRDSSVCRQKAKDVTLQGFRYNSYILHPSGCCIDEV